MFLDESLATLFFWKGVGVFDQILHQKSTYQADSKPPKIMPFHLFIYLFIFFFFFFLGGGNIS